MDKGSARLEHCRACRYSGLPYWPGFEAGVIDCICTPETAVTS